MHPSRDQDKKSLNPSDILHKLKITPKKVLGQNFLNDINLLNKIISLASIKKEDIVLEIGAGLGYLTAPLAQKAKKVYAVEIEPKFCQYLTKELSSYTNIQIINEDILKLDIPECTKVVSNIPFSITGPILEHIFFRTTPPEAILTIEKKLADRIFYKGDYKDFSRITVSVNSFMNPVKHLWDFRNCFYPPATIGVSLIKLLPKTQLHPFLKIKEHREFYLKFLAGIFPYKNKNIVNAIKLFYKKCLKEKMVSKEILEVLHDNDYQNRKVSKFNLNDFPQLCEIIYNLNYTPKYKN